MTNLSVDAKRELLARMLRERAARSAAARNAASEGVALLPPGSERPLSFGQERMWFLNQLDPGSPVYNLVFRVAFTGRLDVEALRRSVESVIARHEALRTTFPASDGRPVQVIAPAGRWDLPVVDISHFPEDQRELQARRHAESEARLPFDLATGPLLRTTLVKLSEQEHVLVLIVHHIVCDGWSLNLIFQELAALYRAHVTGTQPAVPELPVQYADFAAWQRRWLSGKPLETQRAYWLGQLAGTLPILELPTDRLPPKNRTFEGATCNARVAPEVGQALRELSRRQGVTLYTTLLAAFKTLLMRYSGQEDVIVGTLVAGRVRPEIESLVGFYVNTLALRTDLSGDPTFLAALARVREVVTGAQSNADFPFEKLIEELQPERDLTRSPLFQVLFNMLSFGFESEVELPGVAMKALPSLDILTVTDGLTFYALDHQGQLDLCFVYSPELFEAQSIERMCEHFQVLLAGIAQDPEQRLSRLPLLAPGERERLLAASAGIEEAFPIGDGFQRLFEAQVRRTPDAIAVMDDDRCLSYFELNAAANRIARSLIDAGVGPDQPVALLGERGATLVTWILAVFKAGAAYLPLDPRYPPGRHAEILRQSRAPVVIVADTKVDALQRALEDVPPEQRPRVLHARQLSSLEGGGDDPPGRATPSSLAYIIFTSGSTGVPKGAMVPHRAMLNHFFSKLRGLALTADDVVLQSAPIGFDISVWQMLAVLLAGGRVRIASDEVTRDPERLFELVRNEHVTIMEIVPSFLRSYLDGTSEPAARGRAFGRLRWLILGGEALTPDLCRRWLERWPDTPMINGYGPSECADDVARHAILEPPAPAERTVPIGRPIHNLRIYVLDKMLGLLPVGVPGELCVGGVGVGLGYLNDRRRTDAAFVPDPFGPPGALLYRTGDRARLRSDGLLEFLGRVDHQVKIRGHRIELGEIEAVLARHSGVRQCLVTVWPSSFGDRLVAYVVPTDAGNAPNDDALRQHLRAVLPLYMVPDAFVLLDAFPLNANGKVNRKALPAPVLAAQEDYVPPATPTEQAVANVWSAVLGLDRVGAHDNFFELGGHSLLAAQAAARLQLAFNLEVPVRLLFEKQTVKELAAHLADRIERMATAREEMTL